MNEIDKNEVDMKVVICTPAGREEYLQILKQNILTNPLVSEWHLWQNCRRLSDLHYLNKLKNSSNKIKIIEEIGADGTNKSVNRFYRHCNEADTFYIKMDDDIVYMHPDAIARLLTAAIEERGRFLYWTPIVINNAISSAVLSAKGMLGTGKTLSAQANDNIAWKSPLFAKKLHSAFLDLLESGRASNLLKDYRIPLGAQRFSINCIGFWGGDVLDLGENFCPPGVDDEEWISAILPIKTGLPGRIIGNALVAHYAFYTQESYLNSDKTLLARYAKLSLADLNFSINKPPLKKILSSHFSALKGYTMDYINNTIGLYTASQKANFFVKLGSRNEN